MQRILDFFSNAINVLQNFNDIERAMISLSILVIFFLLRKLFSKKVIRLLLKLTLKTSTEVDERLVLSFKKPLNVFFLVTGVYLAVVVLDVDVRVLLLTNKLFRIATIILVAWGLYNFSSNTVRFFSSFQNKIKADQNELIGRFIAKILKVVIVALGIVLVFSELGYNVTGFITGLGIGGLAFALAAKDTAANIFGGIVIIIDKPFKTGDWIYTPKVEGTVEDINLRSTKIRTFANAVVIVPNADLTTDPITNWSRMKKRRITFSLGVTYSTPKEKIEIVMERIRELLKNHPEIHKQTIFVRLDKFSESSIDIFLYFFTKTTNWEKFLEVKEDINLNIIEIMNKENVSFAFPSRSIYLENNELPKLENQE